MDLRAQAHFRFNRLQRLREAYRTAVTSAEQGQDRLSLPLAFSYEEGGDPGQGVPHRERLHFRLWDRRSFVLAHREQYSKYILIMCSSGDGLSRMLATGGTWSSCGRKRCIAMG